jgi:cytochrome c-type biogenesis protein CcmH
MTVFWIAIGGLMLLALLLLLPALVRRRRPAEDNSAQHANLAVLREQLTQLDAELASGSLGEEQHRLARAEIERRVLEEESVGEAAAARPARATSTVLLVGLFVPLFSLGIYLNTGNPEAVLPQTATEGEVTMTQVQAMVDQLAQRLETKEPEPGDAQGWEMLARSYTLLQRFPEAVKAYARAGELAPANAQLLADHAGVLAIAQGQRMAGGPTELIERALQLDPNNLKALALAGSAAMEREDYATAIVHWTKARSLAPADNEEFTRSIDSSLVNARAGQQASGQGAATTSPAMAASAAATSPLATAPAARITGVVTLAPALAARVSPTDTVFIFARAAQGPRMPLAIVRAQARDLPIPFTLDDSTAMSPELSLSRFSEVVVSARISRSGEAMAQPGDLLGQSAPVKNVSSNLKVVIDQTQP